MEKEGKIVLLTWVSWSWKSTLQNELINNYWWTKPINYTTRKPRWQNPYKLDWTWDFCTQYMDEYIYVSHDDFIKKILNWDFAEFTNYNWEFYWMTKFIDYSKNNIIIVDPIWLVFLKKKFRLEERKFISCYLEITKQTQEYRLGVIRRETSKVCNERAEDFKYFPYFEYDLILDWEWDLEDNISQLFQEIWLKKV
jgi:guanylate kinase